MDMTSVAGLSLFHSQEECVEREQTPTVPGLLLPVGFRVCGDPARLPPLTRLQNSPQPACPMAPSQDTPATTRCDGGSEVNAYTHNQNSQPP